MNKRSLKFIAFMTLLFSSVNIDANSGQEGRDFGGKLLPNQGPSDSDGALNQKLPDLPGYSNYKHSGITKEEQEEHTTITQSSSTFNAHLDNGAKDSDAIQQDLLKRNNQHSSRVSNPHKAKRQDVETMFRNKHRWHINEKDPLFYVYDKVSKEEEAIKQGYDIPDTLRKERLVDEIIKCREGAIGNTQTCTKRLIVRAVPQPDIVRNITAHFTARCYNLVTFSINLVTGNIAVSQCENPGPMELSVDKPIGTDVDLSKVSIQLVAKQHTGEEGVDFRTERMNPAPINGFTAVFTAFQPKTSNKDKHEDNKNNVRGGRYIWKVTIPQNPILESYWEGCEDLEKKTEDSFCELAEGQQKGINEARVISGYPSLVTQPYWEEDRIYLCGQGSNANECELLKSQNCDQIDSKCLVQKNNTCIEYEQTYKCPAHKYKNNNGLLYKGTEIQFLQGQGEGERKEAYDAQDFGESITYWSAVKEMNNQLKDGLSGILGDPNNPSIFHGKCQRCSVTLGSFFKDCCKLKGIAMGLLGGCKQGEKELANAAVKDKRCHKVSDLYCSNKVVGVCVEKKEAYCCYGSQIAKIVQEIAHYQLGIGWGTGEEPNCRSLTAAELSRIDFDTPFAREKLSVLIAEIQATAQEKFNKVQGNVAGGGDMKARTETLQKTLDSHYSKDRPSRTRGSK